jgi:hypothetical protein
MTDLSAYFSVLPTYKAMKEIGSMKYTPKHTSALISQLNADLPNIIQTLFLMEKRLRILTHILETKTEADKIIDKMISENPNWKIELTSE